MSTGLGLLGQELLLAAVHDVAAVHDDPAHAPVLLLVDQAAGSAGSTPRHPGGRMRSFPRKRTTSPVLLLISSSDTRLKGTSRPAVDEVPVHEAPGPSPTTNGARPASVRVRRRSGRW